MKKLCFIALWVGKLPENFWLWRESVRHNSDVDFYFVSDQKNVEPLENLHTVYMTLEQIRERFQKIVDVPIVLKTPYKLCDYKPLWGKAFSEFTKDYEFWGHCDIDLVFGNIRSFVTDELLDANDKLFDAGFCIIYRNNQEMNELYKRSASKDNMAYSYIKAFRTQYACYFDEYMGMSILSWKYCKVYRDQLEEKMVQDFGWQQLNFQSYITKEYFLFQWKDGKLYRWRCDENGKLLSEQEPEERMLVHIQKRKMKFDFSEEELQKKNEFWIVPNCYQLEQPKAALNNSEQREAYMEKIRLQDKERSKRNLKAYGIVSYIPHFLTSRKIRKWIIEEKKFF